ncbi:MAG: JAB domain-containing protein [bacterium]|nr:JAB domain-containing protein [bacterium]
MIEKLTKEEKNIKMRSSSAMYRIMHKILLRKSKIFQDKEHLWLMVLDSALNIKSLDVISIGTVNETLGNPMEIYSIAMKKRAVYISLIHNHPSGELLPSKSDIDLTNQVIQVGKMHSIPLIDKLIIGQNGYFSFKDTGLLLELEMSLKYIPHYKFWEKITEILSNEEYLNKSKRFINV